jgi:hypothetical protein
MKSLLATAAVLALAMPAAASPCPSGWEQHGDFCERKSNDVYVLPPAEYDKPFNGALVESIAKDMQDMADWCAPHPRAATLMGCAYRVPNLTGEQRCYIYIAPKWYLDKFRVTADAIRRHERAHCLGWPKDHPRNAAPPTAKADTPARSMLIKPHPIEPSLTREQAFDPNPVYRTTP